MDALATDTWEAVLGALELQVTRPVYETWLKDTEGVSIADQLLTVAVPTAFAVEWLERRMYHTIRQTVQQVTSQPLEVVFQVRNGVHSPAGADRSNTGPLGGSTPNTYLSSSPLSAKYTFNSFVVGPLEPASLQRGLGCGRSTRTSLSPLVHLFRSRPGEDPPVARHRPHLR